jgi:hypothetical protein
MMKTGIALLVIMLSIAGFGASLSPLPDLQIKQYEFHQSDVKKVRVLIVNTAMGASGPAQIKPGPALLHLTVQKIGDAQVSRKVDVELPNIPGKESKWLMIDAAGILPKNVALKDTAFRLDIDPTHVIDEIDEDNNQAFHKPSARGPQRLEQPRLPE